MKTIDTPRTGKIGNIVVYPSAFGQCAHEYTVPRQPDSVAQARARSFFGWSSRTWSLKLSDLQRDRWDALAQQVPSHPSLGQYGHLSGQRLCIKINNTLLTAGKPPVQDPPDPVVFGLNPVGSLLFVNDPEGGVRLLLNVGTLSEDIMVYGRAPCSAGRRKLRWACYLGLLGPVINGLSDITALYVARFGLPGAGRRIFIVTCQEKNGWQGQDNVISGVVPPGPLPGK
jgi:hypothetical protein